MLHEAMPQIDNKDCPIYIFTSMYTLADYYCDVSVTRELLDLCVACPIDGGNPNNCLFHHIRNMSSGDQLLGIVGLNTNTKKRMIGRHQQCMERKQVQAAARER